MSDKKVLVTGAGGFIGHHLVKRLILDGYQVRGVDIKYPEFEPSPAQEFKLLDLREYQNCLEAAQNIDFVYNLAADMGGIGYITERHANIARNNILINSHMLEASRVSGVDKFLFSSSACIYPQYKQDADETSPLKEEDAYPADPEPGYGWEKLFAEELCKYYLNDYGFETKSVRFHNVYGPLGTYEGGKEKAPAAICRKIAHTAPDGEIDVWGDGNQIRSFMYVDDCVEGIRRIMDSEIIEPVNLGSEEAVTINELIDIVEKIALKSVRKNYDLSKPQGVRGRNSDNTKLRELLGWEPEVTLQYGLRQTYSWIESELSKSQELKAGQS